MAISAPDRHQLHGLRLFRGLEESPRASVECPGVIDWRGVTVENVWEGAGIHITFLDRIIALCDPNDMVNTPFSCKPQLSITGLFSCCHRFKHTGHSFRLSRCTI